MPWKCLKKNSKKTGESCWFDDECELKEKVILAVKFFTSKCQKQEFGPYMICR